MSGEPPQIVSALRVLAVVASTDRRGAEVFAVELGGALEARGHTVETVALAPGRTGGLKLVTLGRRARSPATLGALRRRAREVDVVIAHGSTTLPACAVALVGTRVPFVYRNIGDPRHWSASGLRRARVALALRRAAAVVAIAGAARDVLVRDYGVAAERVVVIPTAVDEQRFSVPGPDARAAARTAYGLSPDAVVLAIVGALSEEKDVGAAIAAVAELDDAHLLVVGDGPLRSELEAQAASVAPGRVHFAGTQVDPRAAYAAADLVVCTSRTEGLPAVLVEAGLSGVPVVATDVGFVGEIVEDGETGVLVPLDDRAALVAGIRHGLANPAALADRARGHCAARFSLGAAAERWETVLQNVG